MNNKKQIFIQETVINAEFQTRRVDYDLLYRLCLCISGNSEFGKLKIGMFEPDRKLAPALKIDVGFWAVLLPIITPLGMTINAVTAPFAREMRWGGVAYTRRKVVGYTDNSSWRADAHCDNILL